MEKQKLQNDLKALNKDLKIKEKEICRLQKIEDNGKETIKRLKDKNSELSSEKKKVEKSKQKLEKKSCKKVKLEEAIVKPVEERSVQAETEVPSDKTSPTSDLNSNVSCILASSSTCSSSDISTARVTSAELLSDMELCSSNLTSFPKQPVQTKHSKSAISCTPSYTPPGTPPRPSPPPGGGAHTL